MPEPYFSTDLLGNNPNYQWVFDNSRPVYAEYAQPQYSMEIADMSNNSPATPPQKSTNWSNIGKYMKGGMNLATAALQDITDILGNTKSQINDKPFYDFSQTNTFDDLSHNNLHLASTDQLTRPTFGSSFMDINMRTARGAIAGLSLGPWGALGGAIGGTLSGVANSIAKATTYHRDINRLNRLNNQAIDNYHNDFTKTFNDINNKQINMTNLQRSRNMFAEGGNINTTIQTGGTHEENPFGGVQLGVDAQGTPNLVEEGEVVYNDYVFSNRIKPQKDILQKFNTLFKKSFNSYADIATHINQLHEAYADDPMHKQTKDIQMQRLAQAQDYQKISNEAAEYGMSPEEYMIYNQQVPSPIDQPQQPLNDTSTMSYGGHLYPWGGQLPTDHTQNRLVKNYWESKATKTDAYYLDEYGKWLNQAYVGAVETPQKREQYYYIERKARAILAKDPKAQIYLKDHFGLTNDELNNILKPLNIPTVRKISGNRIQENSKLGGFYGTSYQFIDRVGDWQQEPTGVSEIPTDNITQVDQIQSNSQPTIYANNNGYDYRGNSVNRNSYQYWDPATRQLIQQMGYNQLTPEQQQSLYRIGTRKGKGYDGTIDYADNAAYMDKYNNLSDDDWNQIKKQLNERYNNQYQNYDIEQLKRGGQDGLFGNIHKEAINYIWDRDFNKPVDAANVPAEVVETIQPTTVSRTAARPDVNASPMSQTQPTSRFDAWVGMNNPLRYAPVFDNARSLIEQNNPDYTYSNQLASLYQPLDYNPTGERMRYTPVDQYYLANQAEIARNTQMGAYRNNANTNQGNAYMNSMVNQQANNLIGDNYIKALQQNEQMRNQALQYNNQLDAQNEANRLNVQAQNASNYAQIMGNSSQAAEEERLAVENAREANKQNMAANLGLIGKEQSDYYNVNHNPALMYGAFGTFYKGLTPEQQKSFDNIWNNTFNK